MEPEEKNEHLLCFWEHKASGFDVFETKSTRSLGYSVTSLVFFIIEASTPGHNCLLSYNCFLANPWKTPKSFHLPKSTKQPPFVVGHFTRTEANYIMCRQTVGFGFSVVQGVELFQAIQHATGLHR